jgi:hypothetical protein
LLVVIVDGFPISLYIFPNLHSLVLLLQQKVQLHSGTFFSFVLVNFAI